MEQFMHMFRQTVLGRLWLGNRTGRIRKTMVRNLKLHSVVLLVLTSAISFALIYILFLQPTASSPITADSSQRGNIEIMYAYQIVIRKGDNFLPLVLNGSTPTPMPSPTPIPKLKDGDYLAEFSNGGEIWFTVSGGGNTASMGGFLFKEDYIPWCYWVYHTFDYSTSILDGKFSFQDVDVRGYQGNDRQLDTT